MNQRYEGKQGIGGEVSLPGAHRLVIPDARLLLVTDAHTRAAAVNIYAFGGLGLSDEEQQSVSGLSVYLWPKHREKAQRVVRAMSGLAGGDT